MVGSKGGTVNSCAFNSAMAPPHSNATSQHVSCALLKLVCGRQQRPSLIRIHWVDRVPSVGTLHQRHTLPLCCCLGSFAVAVQHCVRHTCPEPPRLHSHVHVPDLDLQQQRKEGCVTEPSLCCRTGGLTATANWTRNRHVTLQQVVTGSMLQLPTSSARPGACRCVME